MRIQRTALFALLTVTGLVACSDGSDGDSSGSDAPAVTDAVTDSGAPAPESGAGITIKDFAFTAPEVAAGATVEVTNEDGTTHTVTADDGSFQARVDGGAAGTITAPSAPGSYSFHCEIHPSMAGTLVVSG